MTADENRDVLDEAALWRNFEGDRALLVEIVQTFLRLAPSYLADVRGAVAGGDAAALERAAHRLKGAVGLFHATAAQDGALTLLTMGMNNDLAGAPRALADLERDVARLCDVLCNLADLRAPGPGAP